MIKKIVLTGGPGTGKTTVLEKIKEVYSLQGYRVIIIDETATYLILKGIKPFGDEAIDIVDFQELVMRMQLAKEEVFEKAAKMMGEENVIIVYDRGTIDNSAYINASQFQEVLTRLNNVKSFADLMNNYDLIIDLVGRRDFYTLENNEARSEDPDTALELGNNTLKSWIGHSKVKIVMPKDTMDEKVKEVLNIINELLNEKQVKRQDKYSVDLSKTNLNEVINNGRSMHILQTYLQSEEKTEKRIRKVEFNGCVSYSFSVYHILDDGSRVIVSEKEIDQKVYEQLLEFGDLNRETLGKTRYYFAFNGQYFSLDVFDNGSDVGVLEINISDGEVVSIPLFIKVINNVTNDPNFYNRNIALKAGKELKKEI